MTLFAVLTIQLEVIYPIERLYRFCRHHPLLFEGSITMEKRNSNTSNA